MGKLSPGRNDLSKGFRLIPAATSIPGKSGRFSEGRQWPRGKPMLPNQGLPGNALKAKEGGEERKSGVTRPQSPSPATPPSSSPSPKPLSYSSGLQSGPGVMGGQPPSTTPLPRLPREKRGWRAPGVPQFRLHRPLILGTQMSRLAPSASPVDAAQPNR